MKIVMDVGISGGRGDGTHWPPVGGVLEVGDREGAALCAAGLAHPYVEERAAETRPAPDTAERRATPAPRGKSAAAKSTKG